MCGVEAKIRQSCVQETDSGRATLTDIFCNTSGFSAKTVQAIYKETLYKVGTIECSKFDIDAKQFSQYSCPTRALSLLKVLRAFILKK